MTPARTPPVLAFATLGQKSNEEDRLRELLSAYRPVVVPFDRQRKLRSGWAVFQAIGRDRPRLAVMEGTGSAGGAALMLARLLYGTPYVVSSGDAVGPWVGGHYRLLGPVFGLYERLLCRLAAGYIGWTPYLVGRALTFGCPRGMTAAGWAPFRLDSQKRAAERDAVRSTLGFRSDDLVVGLAGSLIWSRRHRYCYGLELVAAAARVTRPDVRFLIVGDGDGKARLEQQAAALPPGRVVFTGRLSQDVLPGHYAAMDVASLPQSLDKIGSFRYTTKLSEYLAHDLGVLCGPIPATYDLGTEWVWRVPGGHPWEPTYHVALADLLDRLTPEEVQAKRTAAAAAASAFDRDEQVARVTAFLNDLIGPPEVTAPST